VFLRRCGLAVAVANALPTVKEIADLVTEGARGAGVSELIDRWLAGDLEGIPQNPARAPEVAPR
jgi:hydroxymethylpyrimidine pyrophosphatase-like HAD family hydrolase